MTNEKFVVEDNFNELVKEILRENGFEDIKRMPRASLYDYMAKRDGVLAFIEVKIRSPNARTQTFVLRENQLERLNELEVETGSTVYLFLMNRYGYRLVRLRDFLAGKTDLKPMQVCFSRKKDTGSFLTWYFDASKARWRELSNRRGDSKGRTTSSLRVWRIKDDMKLYKHFYKVIPYDEICKELSRGREVFVEGITRQTAWFACKKLSELMKKQVVYGVATLKFNDGNEMKGYYFSLAGESSSVSDGFSQKEG